MLYRYLISKGTGSTISFKSAARDCRAAIIAFQSYFTEEGLWDTVEPHIVGYDWLYDQETRQSMRFALLDDEWAAVVCEMRWSRTQWSNLPYFPDKINSDGSVYTGGSVGEAGHLDGAADGFGIGAGAMAEQRPLGEQLGRLAKRVRDVGEVSQHAF